MTSKYQLYRLRVLIPFAILLAITAVFLFLEKGQIVLWLNQYHNPQTNFFFKKVSSIGNALTIFLFLLITLRYKLKYVYSFLLAFAIESFVVIVSKHLFFDGTLRPYLFFKEQGVLDAIHFVKGIPIRKKDSFPSGHTAYSFFLATFFAFKINKISAASVLFFLAALVGVSRMFLVQHFFVDVFVGAIVGVVATTIAFVVMQCTHKNWLEYRLLFNFRKNSFLVLVND